MVEPPNTYSVDYECGNCGYNGPIEFCYGIKAALLVYCTKCGIQEARKKVFDNVHGDCLFCTPQIPIDTKTNNTGQPPVINS